MLRVAPEAPVCRKLDVGGRVYRVDTRAEEGCDEVWLAEAEDVQGQITNFCSDSLHDAQSEITIVSSRDKSADCDTIEAGSCVGARTLSGTEDVPRLDAGE